MGQGGRDYDQFLHGGRRDSPPSIIETVAAAAANYQRPQVQSENRILCGYALLYTSA
jgi:hypothetical protein